MKGGKNKKQMGKNNGIIITSIIAVVVLIVSILALTTFNSAIPSGKDSVTVQGISTIKAMPDVVSVYINIQTNGTTNAKATSENTKIYNKLLEEIVLAGFEEGILKTESFSVYENTYWDSKEEKSKKDGYIANHYLKVELDADEISKVSNVIDATVNAGAGISYINFELSKKSQNEYKSQALKEASKDAKIKAESIASGFDLKIGKLLSVQTSDFGYYPWNVYTTRSAGGMDMAEDAVLMKSSVMEMEPGEEEVYASITATFKMK